jgi:hypothetical protein
MSAKVFLLFLAVVSSVVAQQVPDHPHLEGFWVANFADSLFSGKIYLSLTMSQDGTIAGTYKANTGGEGTVIGKVEDANFHFELTQTLKTCEGTYKGTVKLTGDVGTGSYSGKDCQGEHTNGVVTLSRVKPDQVHVAKVDQSIIIPAGTIYVDGRRFWVGYGADLLVVLAAELQGQYLVFKIGIRNFSDKQVTFSPSQIIVYDDLEQKDLRYYSPEEVADRYRRAAAWQAFFAGLGASFSEIGRQLTPVTSYTYVSGHGTVVTETYQPSDPGAVQRRTREATEPIIRGAEREGTRITQISARANTLMPNDFIAGSVHFSKPKRKSLKNLLGIKRKDYFVRVGVPLHDRMFMFPFPIEALEEAVRSGGITVER